MIQDIAIHQLINKTFELVEYDASVNVDTEKKALLVDVHLEIAIPEFVIHTLNYFDN